MSFGIRMRISARNTSRIHQNRQLEKNYLIGVSDMSRPKWEDAPEWANWLAQDQPANAATPTYWVWFEQKPTKMSNGWIDKSNGRWLETRIQALNADWKSTLEQRP